MSTPAKEQPPGAAGSPPILRLRGDATLVAELHSAFIAGSLSAGEPSGRRSPDGMVELVIALGSAGVFTAAYQIIGRVLARHGDREIALERRGVSIRIKGHNLPESLEILRKIAPELLRSKAPRARPD